MAKLISKSKVKQAPTKMAEIKPNKKRRVHDSGKKKKAVINLPVNIFLIGFMGSGKTHWGSVWAKENGSTFYDLDEIIESKYGKTITDIFDNEGEEKFRQLESDHLRKFKNKKNFILACGGGTPCFSDNMEWMKSQGKVIYLKAEPEILLKRLMGETEKRPVIKKVNPTELLRFIQNKLEEREPFYSMANFILKVEELNEKSLSDLLSTIR
jgi:shikimate kinase